MLMTPEAEALFNGLREEMGDEPALTPLHWLLIQRACNHLVTVAPPGESDKVIVSLLSEPLRALRTHSSLMVRVQTEITRVLRGILTADQMKLLISELRQIEASK